MSHLDLIAGPNGAGKTTLYERVIHPGRPGLPWPTVAAMATGQRPRIEPLTRLVADRGAAAWRSWARCVTG